MTNTVNKREKLQMPARIRNKLMAAICMLLVSCIMLVSSTYAWFTLSTAPEVAGITTNVGANGNLEMMLLNSTSYASSADNLGVITSVNDSSAVSDVTVANEKWGNLVDLTSTKYGLANVTLMPAKLNVNGTTIGDSILYAPSYGSDGRVIEVETPTYSATNSNGSFVYDTTAAGVRAIGTTSGVTIRLSAYRSALSTASANVNNVLTSAKSSLKNNAEGLSNIIMALVNENSSADYSSHVDTLENIITSIKTANGYAEIAIKNAVLAYQLSAANNAEMSDDDVRALQDSVLNSEINELSGSLPNGAAEAITSYTNVAGAIAAAESKLADIKEAASVNAAALRSVLDELVVTGNVTVAGFAASSANKDNIIGAIVADVTAPVAIVLGDGSGVYDDLADMSGYFVEETKLSINPTDFGVTALGNATIGVKGTMSTTPGVNGSVNTAISAIQAAGQPSESAGGTITLGDTYGYALDFGFRTNAASSNLLLQTAPVQRVYSDSQAETTMGFGSSMAFTSTSTNFTTDEVTALMSAIRVAFVSPKEAGYDLLAVGALDITATTDQQGVTTYTGATVNGNTVSANLFLYEYGISSEKGNIVLGNKKADKSPITDLTQNKAKKVSVIVYLDGEMVDNTMVANARQSMAGILNLQFSSDASLKAMENTGMRNGGVSGN